MNITVNDSSINGEDIQKNYQFFNHPEEDYVSKKARVPVIHIDAMDDILYDNKHIREFYMEKFKL